MADKRLFVQFIHPGGEHTANAGRFRTWNVGPHKRKFLEIRGSYAKNGKALEDMLYFWGEWEPESEIAKTVASPLPDGTDLCPQAILGDAKVV